MTRRAKALSATVAITVVAALLASVALAGNRSRADQSRTRGVVRVAQRFVGNADFDPAPAGIVFARQRSGGRAAVTISLHNLPSGSRLRLSFGSRCGVTPKSEVFLPSEFIVATGDKDLFKTARGPTSLRLSRAKAVRVYTVGSDGRRTEASCSVMSVPETEIPRD
jgi:hypothetical protein